MPQPSVLILYVADPNASVNFYATLIDRKPVEQSPNFAMFALGPGLMLGLWAKHDVEPTPTTPGGVEIGFTVESEAEVDQLYAQWKARAIERVQEPTRMDFGYTFVAIDPDGHRLRVFKPL